MNFPPPMTMPSTMSVAMEKLSYNDISSTFRLEILRSTQLYPYIQQNKLLRELWKLLCLMEVAVLVISPSLEDIVIFLLHLRGIYATIRLFLLPRLVPSFRSWNSQINNTRLSPKYNFLFGWHRKKLTGVVDIGTISR